MLFLLFQKYPHYWVKHPTDWMGKTVALEDCDETDCDSSVPDMQNKQKEKGGGKIITQISFF